MNSLVELLKIKVKSLEKKLENSYEVAAKFEAECYSLDQEIARLKTEEIARLKTDMDFYRSEYDLQFEANQRLIAEKERLRSELEARENAILRLDLDKDRLAKELDHQKAIASAELDSMHKLGDDYAKVLEDEQKHIQDAKIEAVKEVGKMLMDKCHDGIICAVDVLDIVVDYMYGGV